ncbi:MAG: manganese efflux pump [Clostridia bacterium]|nr:manganese efflux pump [Clostridia bacterium]
MNIFQIFLLCLSITADGFAIAISFGTHAKHISKIGIPLAFWMSFFQITFLILGFLISKLVSIFFSSICNYISTVLLALLGFKMIFDSFSNKKENPNKKSIFLLSFLANLDSFSIGIASFTLKNSIFAICLISCALTILFTFLGIFIGRRFGSKFNSTITFLAGILLIVSSFKILF